MQMPAKFHEIPSMGLQDIKETKRTDGWTDGRTDARTDGRENSIPPLKLRFGGGYNYVNWRISHLYIDYLFTLDTTFSQIHRKVFTTVLAFKYVTYTCMYFIFIT